MTIGEHELVEDPPASGFPASFGIRLEARAPAPASSLWVTAGLLAEVPEEKAADEDARHAKAKHHDRKSGETLCWPVRVTPRVTASRLSRSQDVP